MGFLETIQKGVRGHFDKKKVQKELIDRLRLEADVQRQQIFEEEFKKNALLVAQSQAKKQAAELSGLRKLRAMNRVRTLKEPKSSDSFFSKLAEHTQRNLAKREENLERTKEIRTEAKKMRDERLIKQQELRESRMARSKPFAKSYLN